MHRVNHVGSMVRAFQRFKFSVRWHDSVALQFAEMTDGPIAVSCLHPDQPFRAFGIVRTEFGRFGYLPRSLDEAKQKGSGNFQNPDVDRDIPNPWPKYGRLRQPMQANSLGSTDPKPACMSSEMRDIPLREGDGSRAVDQFGAGERFPFRRDSDPLAMVTMMATN